MNNPLFLNPRLVELYDSQASWESEIVIGGRTVRRREAEFSFYMPMLMAADRVLDVGCGTGELLRLARAAGHSGRLCGVDLMPEWIEKGARLYPHLELLQGSGDRLAAADESFDVVHQGMVFSSVLEGDLRRTIAGQMDRVLRRQGYLIWYDFFFNPKNADTVGMTLRRVRELFAGWPIIYRARVMPAAPLARMVERVWGGGLRLMSRLKVLNFHYLLVLQKP